jgi:hypothetical protein
MKKLLLIYVLLSTLHTAGQELSGKYSTHEPIGGVAILFDKEQETFNYSADNCAGGIFGKGTFSIKKNKLYLYFEKKPQLPEIPIKVPLISVDSLAKEGYSITVKVMNNKKADTPIPSASVHVAGTKIGAITDSKGIATLKLNYPSHIDRLTISAVDCEAETIYLREPGVYSITVFINCGSAIFIDNGQVQTYDIGNYDEDYIELRTIYSGGEKSDYKKYYLKKE